MLGLGSLLAVAMLLSAEIGSEPIDLRRALFGKPCAITGHEPGGAGAAPLWQRLRCRYADNVDATILFQVRVPRVLLAALVGGALAAAGAVLQALLRNPLAEPHLLGVSGGAAFGAAVMLALGAGSGSFPELVVPAGGFAGALCAMLLVYRLGTVHGRLQPYTFLLAGVVCNAFTGALIMALNAVADFLQAHGIIFWLMGNLQANSYWLVLGGVVYLSVGVLWLMRHARAFNVLSLGEETAAQLGVDVARVRRGAFIMSSLLVGAAVSVSGMIGFVGLIVPHVTRLLIGPDYRLLLPAAVLIGGTFLLAADTVARSAFGPTEIPVGVITALCGGPFFIYLLRRAGGRSVD
ncbi:MAG: FecCD family ABC transporter permease [Candidatus Binatia bacterium]